MKNKGKLILNSIYEDINKIKQIAKNMDKKRIVVVLLISLIIEIFVCNFPAFRTLIYAENKNVQPNYTIENNAIIISDINTRVTCVNINYNKTLEGTINYDLKYEADESSYINSINKKVLLGEEKQYINLDTHSNCKTIKIQVETENVIDNQSVESVVINKINFNINYIRIILIYMILILAVKIKDGSILKKVYQKNNEIQKIVFKYTLGLFCIMIFFYTKSQYGMTNMTVRPQDIIEKYDRILSDEYAGFVQTEDLALMQTEAIINGKLSLLQQPSKILKEMKNPYDYEARNKAGITYLFDTTYYNGQYYSYFGIAPVITCILPFRLITGVYLQFYIFTLIYVFGILYALYALYRKVIDKYVKKDISLFNFYLGFYAIVFGSNIINMIRGAKYQIAEASGIFFLLIAMNLAISFNKNKKLKWVKLVMLGLSTGLIVLSKPTFIVYYPIILFLFLSSMKNIDKKNKILNFVIAFIPVCILAILQMILNYLRFDSIFEFGAKYQLTGQNMNYCMSFTFGKTFAGLIGYIFKIPLIIPSQFPFIFTNRSLNIASTNEICYESMVFGLIGIPILWVYFLASNILKEDKNRELKNLIKFIIVTSIIIMILTTNTGGISEEYAIDFKLILCIGAVILLLKDCKNKYMNKILLITCIITIVMMIPISFSTEERFLENCKNKNTVMLKNLFEFWR